MAGDSGGSKIPPDICDVIVNQSVSPSLSTTTPWAVGGGSGQNVRMRSFAEIIASEQENRNILEIHVTKQGPNVKSLSHDDLAELIFDVLNIDYTSCLGFNYTTGRYSVREVKFKSGVDISSFIKSGFEFKGHEVSTKKQINNLTKVTFRNDPFNVPDKEIIDLCKSYGNPLD